MNIARMFDATLTNDIFPWDSVPNEVVMEIFSHLSVEDLLRTSLVSRRWDDLSRILFVKSKELTIYGNKKKEKSIDAIHNLLLRIEGIEKINFIGFKHRILKAVLRLLNSTCNNIVEINVIKSDLPRREIKPVYIKLKSKRKIEMRVETRRLIWSDKSHIRQPSLDREIELSTEHYRNKESPWFYEIFTVPPEQRVLLVLCHYSRVKGDIYKRTTYERGVQVGDVLYPRLFIEHWVTSREKDPSFINSNSNTPMLKNMLEKCQ